MDPQHTNQSFSVSAVTTRTSPLPTNPHCSQAPKSSSSAQNHKGEISSTVFSAGSAATAPARPPSTSTPSPPTRTMLQPFPHPDDSRPTLYHVKRAISSPIVQLILELGLRSTIHVQEITFADLKRPEYLQWNPMGTSPAFIDGDFVLWESGAILDYLLETYDTRQTYFQAPNTQTRPKFLQLKQYLIATVYPMVAKWYLRHLRGNNDDDNDDTTSVRDTVRTIVLPYLTKALGSERYFMGDHLTVIDFLAAKPLTNLRDLGELARFPTVQAYFERISSTASYQEAYEGLVLTPVETSAAALLDCASSVKVKKQRLMSWNNLQPNVIS